MIEWRRIALSYPCTTCGSPPGRDCITVSGKKSYTPHYLRTRQAARNQWRDPEATDPSHVGHSPERPPRYEER